MKPSYNPWPWAIVLTFVLFISGTVGLVVMACSQRVDLVSANYYEQELKFQGQLERLKRTSQLGSQAAVVYDAGQKRITISLPLDQARHHVRGQIQLYRPAQADLDRQMELQLDGRGVQSLDAGGLRPGLWRIRVSWAAGQEDYFIEQKIVIPAKPSWYGFVDCIFSWAGWQPVLRGHVRTPGPGAACRRHKHGRLFLG